MHFVWVLKPCFDLCSIFVSNEDKILTFSVEIEDIEINGTVSALTGKTVALLGDLSATGSIKKLTLGNLASGAGLFEADTGHLSADGDAMAVRMGDAMRRGFLCGTRAGGEDLLSIDWFALADQPLEDVRRRFHVVPKRQDAWEAGSVTAWEQGGISPFQYRQGQDAAVAAGRAYRNHGATPATP